MKKALFVLLLVGCGGDTVEIPGGEIPDLPVDPLPPPIIYSPPPPPPPPPSDLQADFAVRDTTPEPSSVLVMYSTVKNHGDGPSLPELVWFLESADSLISREDSVLGEVWLKGLQSQHWEMVQFSHQLPDEEATYIFGACVSSRQDGSNRDNNCSDALEVLVEESDSGN